MKTPLPTPGRSTHTEAADLRVPGPDWEVPPKNLTEQARRALYEVRDPELPISLMDLGLIYELTVQQHTAYVRMTFTATGCPCLDMIQQDVRARLREIPGIDNVEITIVWDPPWTTDRISPRGKKKLQEAGVSV